MYSGVSCVLNRIIINFFYNFYFIIISENLSQVMSGRNAMFNTCKIYEIYIILRKIISGFILAFMRQQYRSIYPRREDTSVRIKQLPFNNIELSAFRVLLLLFLRSRRTRLTYVLSYIRRETTKKRNDVKQQVRETTA